MSDILIKNMEMPKCCYDCNFCKYLKEECGDFTDTNGLIYHYKHYFYCDLIKNSQFLDSEALHGKHCDCPIIEVPKHGRLIDADALKEKKKHSNEFAENVVSVAEIDWMPTIIEAEGT